jgi:hypothetical protein
MPEAYTQTRELLGEIKRCRPQWVRSDLPRKLKQQLLHDWRKAHGGFWDRLRVDPEHEAQTIRRLQEPALNQVREHVRSEREKFKTVRADWVGVGLSEIRAQVPTTGEMVHPWRMSANTTCTTMLRQSGNAYREWLSDQFVLEGTHVDQRDWLDFWMKEVRSKHMPRFWIRWAIEYLQMFTKFSSGVGGDSQVASYLIDADVLASADARLIDMVETLRLGASCSVPRTFKSSGGSAAAEDILEALSIGFRSRRQENSEARKTRRRTSGP